MKIFILEDEVGKYPRNQIIPALASHQLTIAKNVPEAKKIFQSGLPYDLMLLDHDMEGFFEDPNAKHGNTGTAFVRWLVEQPWLKDFDLPDVVLHSHNTEGKKEMSLTLRDHGFEVQSAYFNKDYVEALRKI